MLEILAFLSLIGGAAILAVLSYIDLKIGLLPNIYVLAFLILGLVFHGCTGLHFLSLFEIVMGGIVGTGILYIIRALAERFYSEDSLGLGDVKLMGAAGIWLGPYFILVALSVGALAGIVHGLVLACIIGVKTKSMPSLAKLSLPAGPGFAAGIIITAIYAFKNFPFMIGS